MGVALVAALSVLATVSTAIASPLPQQFLPPPLREHVVSFVPDLAESELVDGHKILPHLKLGEMLPAKRINIVDSAPDIAVQPSVLGGQEFSVSRFDTSQPHSVSRIRRHDRWGRGYGRFAEDEYLLFRSLGSKIGFDFDDDGISRSFTGISKDQVNRPLLLIRVANIGAMELREFYQNIGAQLSFGGTATVSHLKDNDNYQPESDDSKRINLLQVLSDRISLMIGAACCAIGIAIYLNSRGVFGSIVGIALMILGVFFPWGLVI